MKTRRNRATNGYITHPWEPREMGIITPSLLYQLNMETEGYGHVNRRILPKEYVRPSDWLAMPDMTSGDEKVAMLLHIVKGASGNIGATADSNFIAFAMSGPYIVDWGDGTTQAFAAGATAQYAYNFASVSGGTSTETSLGFRQVVIQAYPQSGSPFKYIDLNRVYRGNGVTGFPPFGPFPSQIVHLKICGATCSNVDLGQGFQSGGLTSSMVSFNSLQLFEYVGSSGLTTTENLFSVNKMGLRSVWGSEWTANVVNMQGMFNRCYSLERAPMLNTSNTTRFTSMFQQCSSLAYVPQYDTSNATTFGVMFNGCSSLDGEGFPTLDASKVIDFGSMFQDCISLRRFLVPPLKNVGKGTTSNAIQMGFIFNMSSVVGSLRCLRTFFTGVDTRNVSDMSFAFSNVLSLAAAPNIYLGGVTGNGSSGLQLTFNNCQALQWVPPWYLGSLAGLNSTFNNCQSLRYVPDFKFDAASVTNSSNNMQSMFQNCYALVSWGGGALMDTSHFVNFSSLFNNCYSLNEMPNLKTNNATNMSSMFANCYALQKTRTFNTERCANFSSMFQNGLALTAAPDFNTSSGTNFASMFSSCYALETAMSLSAGTGLTPNMGSMYSACYSLKIPNNMNLSNVRNASGMFSTVEMFNDTFPYMDTSKFMNIANFFPSGCLYIPYLDVGGITHNSNMMNFSSYGLVSGGLSGTRTSINYSNNNLSPTALNDIFQGLSAGRGGLTPGTIRTITITNNWGATGCDRTIATNKGWTVSG